MNNSMEKLKAKIDKELKGIREKLSKSPCVFRENQSFADCDDCDGFMKGCSARLTEWYFRHENGRWRESNPW